MDGHRKILKRVGILLIVLGTLDVAVMVYCIIAGVPYSSMAGNLLAILAGISLLRGSLTTARIVAWISAFYLCLAMAIVLASPAFMPLDLLMLKFRLAPSFMALNVLSAVVITASAAWIYHELRSTLVLDARSKAGLTTQRPTVAYATGLALPLVIGVFLLCVPYTDPGRIALALAREQVGPDYRLALTRWSASANGGSAVFTAYTDTEMKYVQVRW